MNLNDYVSVILTKTGADIFNRYADRFVGKIPRFVPKHQKEGDVIQAQLWSLMQVFGANIHLGMPEAPFLDNEIFLE